MQNQNNDYFTEYRKAFDYADQMFLNILEARDTNELHRNSHTEMEWTILMVYHAIGVIGNGGFELYLSGAIDGDPDFSRAHASFREIGAEKAHDVFGEVLACFPGGIPYELDENDKLYHYPIPARRMKLYRAVPEKRRDSLNSEFWKQEEEIIIKLANYIKRNEKKILADLDR